MKDSSIVFFGTPLFAVHTLNALEESGIVPDIIVTAPDKPAGRGLELTPPPVKKWAEEREIFVLQPTSLKTENIVPENAEALALLLNSEWDLFIVSAYGKLLRKDLLILPHKGVLNIHPSLLPKFRGASPIESQILQDEKNVGVSIILLDEEMDHGPLLAQASITPEEWPLKASILEELLATEGGNLLAEVIPEWLEGTITPTEQDHALATVTKKITKEDGEIHLTDDAYHNYLKFCAYDGWPGVYFFIEKNERQMRVKITDASYENGVFTPLSVIPEGKKEMRYEDFIR